MPGFDDPRLRGTHRGYRGTQRLGGLLPVLLFAFSSSGSPTVPEKESIGAQIPILLKILTFDRALEDQPKRDLLIVIVEAPSDSVSHHATELVANELSLYVGQMIRGRPLRTESRSYDQLMERFDATVDVLYLTPGLERTLPQILAWSRNNGSFTFTGAPTLRAKGVSVWLGGAPSAPRILINLPQVRAEGRELDARLLSLATVQR